MTISNGMNQMSNFGFNPSCNQNRNDSWGSNWNFNDYSSQSYNPSYDNSSYCYRQGDQFYRDGDTYNIYVNVEAPQQQQPPMFGGPMPTEPMFPMGGPSMYMGSPGGGSMMMSGGGMPPFMQQQPSMGMPNMGMGGFDPSMMMGGGMDPYAMMNGGMDPYAMMGGFDPSMMMGGGMGMNGMDPYSSYYGNDLASLFGSDYGTTTDPLEELVTSLTLIASLGEELDSDAFDDFFDSIDITSLLTNMLELQLGIPIETLTA